MALSSVDEVAQDKSHDVEKTKSDTVDADDIDVITQSGIHTDLALGLYKESLTLDSAHREMVAAKVRRKLDFILLPMVC